MSVSGIGSAAYYQNPIQTEAGTTAGQEPKSMAEALQEERDRQPDLTQMMKEARERLAEQKKMLQVPKNSRRYGDSAILAYSKLARARSVGEVDAASGYARRQIAQLRAAKRSDSDNADRIQAAINQLQKAVNRAGRKKREISQEKLTARRQERLAQEKRTREAKRLRQQLRSRQTMRVLRESGYLQEAGIDNRIQDQLAVSRLELRQQMQELSDKTQMSAETAARQYTSSEFQPVSEPEISVQA